ncbi:MAG: hypothetical protein D6729_12225 [Deltaproteobacteria bacterium]|nr:MAG: hypothetical protein D6729_12225 [Deltaproteobacteria bacterium]
MEHATAIPALTVALALAAGMLAQALAHHLRIPGIVLLLGMGVLLGPDVAGIVQPASLGQGLQMLVGFAVAVILFEGGMNLDIRRLRREQLAIRGLCTVGALVTAVGGALAAWLLMGWDARTSILFGTLVIVTGPTVIQPLLRRIKVDKKVATVLEAEGIFIDAVGAIVAVVALEVVISDTGREVAIGLLSLPGRLAFGTAVGAIGGFLIVGILKVRHLVPEGLENTLTLALALTLFQVSNYFLPESGIVSVSIAGLVLGNISTPADREILEFKEQLTVMLIGMLFVLLAADVRVAEVVALGWGGVATVAALMLVVRPLNVALGTLGSSLNRKEKIFMSWLAPRGIVAAAVASLFATTLEAQGIAGGTQLRALVFLVIAVTVLVQGLTGGLVASLLGLKRSSRGWVILGAGGLGLALADLLARAEEVVLVDTNPDRVTQAEARGHRVLFANALEERTRLRLELEVRRGVVATTPNSEVNLLFAEAARKESKVPRALVALHRGRSKVTPEMVESIGAELLFGRPVEVDLWSLWLERGQAEVRPFRLEAPPEEGSPLPEDSGLLLLPLVRARGDRLEPVSDPAAFDGGAQVYFALSGDRREAAFEALEARGWVPADAAPEAGAPEAASVVPGTDREAAGSVTETTV